MILRPTPEQQEALRSVAARPDGQKVVEWLRAAQRQAQHQCARMDDLQMVRMMQGVERAFDEVLGFFKFPP